MNQLWDGEWKLLNDGKRGGSGLEWNGKKRSNVDIKKAIKKYESKNE